VTPFDARAVAPSLWDDRGSNRAGLCAAAPRADSRRRRRCRLGVGTPGDPSLAHMARMTGETPAHRGNPRHYFTHASLNSIPGLIAAAGDSSIMLATGYAQ